MYGSLEIKVFVNFSFHLHNKKDLIKDLIQNIPNFKDSFIVKKNIVNDDTNLTQWPKD